MDLKFIKVGLLAFLNAFLTGANVALTGVFLLSLIESHMSINYKVLIDAIWCFCSWGTLFFVRWHEYGKVVSSNTRTFIGVIIYSVCGGIGGVSGTIISLAIKHLLQ